MIKKLCLLLLLSSQIYGSNILTKRLQETEKGDYLAAALNRSFALIIVTDVSPQSLTIEEITVPRRVISAIDKWPGWKQWVANGGKGHICWNRYTLDPTNGEITSGYSYHKQHWFRPSPQYNFLSTLFSLEPIPITLYNRQKTGKEQTIWNPPLYYEGQKIQGAEFDGWTTYWPNDGGELSGKKIVFYLPKEGTPYPAYFPYWLHIEGLFGRGKVRVVDSGKNMISPKKLPGLE